MQWTKVKAIPTPRIGLSHSKKVERILSKKSSSELKDKKRRLLDESGSLHVARHSTLSLAAGENGTRPLYTVEGWADQVGDTLPLWADGA